MRKERNWRFSPHSTQKQAGNPEKHVCIFSGSSPLRFTVFRGIIAKLPGQALRICKRSIAKESGNHAE